MNMEETVGVEDKSQEETDHDELIDTVELKMTDLNLLKLKPGWIIKAIQEADETGECIIICEY